ncbi:hypothetical protein DXG01_003746 [Tephrocybe rancida]|nr:hypothetical protein DXG01_003746 [Tephrocybe rancida]
MHCQPIKRIIDNISLFEVLALFTLELSITPRFEYPRCTPNYGATIAELQEGLDAGHFSSSDLVKVGVSPPSRVFAPELKNLFASFQSYLMRIQEVNSSRPALRAVLGTDPFVLAKAAELDFERKEKGSRGPLHGTPTPLKNCRERFLLLTAAPKDNIVAEGSFAPMFSVAHDEAGVGRPTSQSLHTIVENAHPVGLAWVGRQQVHSNVDPSGSSSGSGVAVSIGLCAVTLGTETDGSIISPSSRNNVVGIKPTVGLTSRAEDSVGPMARCVADAAAVPTIIAGKDPNDSGTDSQPDTVPDFTKTLNEHEALDVIRSLGATVVDPADLPAIDEIRATDGEARVIDADFKIGLNQYLSRLKMSRVRSMAELIQFNNDDPDLEKPEGLIRCQATTGHDAAFFSVLAEMRELGATRGIDAVLQEHDLHALVLPSDGLTSTIPAMAGYPIISGFFGKNFGYAGPQTYYLVPGVPFGISFFSAAYSDFELLGFAYAYEQKTKTQLARKTFAAAIPKTQCIYSSSHARSGSPTMYPDLYEASVAELRAGMDAGHFTSTDLVKAYFARIEEVNLKGPALRAILQTNPFALAKAAELDAERKEKGPRGSLHGIPVLLKDNIATVSSEGMNTTAGTFALMGSVVPDDAGIVKRLRAAGAIILGAASFELVLAGKTNLSELAHYRGDCASGWSAVGGQTTTAYYPNADPGGSSSGSGVAASIGLSAVTIGTETDGSIISPSRHNNIVGVKPTVGLTSRAGGWDVHHTVGPMTRCVADAAVVLSAIAGKDPNDEDTLSQPEIVPDFTKALNTQAFEGKRIGAPRSVFLDNDETGSRSDILAAFEEALVIIRGLGATIVDPADLPAVNEIQTSNSETAVLDADFKVNSSNAKPTVGTNRGLKIELNRYLSNLKLNPSGVGSLADLIKFNDDHPDLEKPEGYEDQSILIRSEATAGHDTSFFEALAANRELGATRGIDAALQEYNLDALVLPSDGLTSTPAAIAGYPVITVPLGFFGGDVTVGRAGPSTVYPAPGVPFGLSFLGTAYSDFELLGFAYAFEQKTRTRLARKAFAAAIPKTQLKDVLNVN